MYRRTLLAGVSAGLAGCTTFGSGQKNNSTGSKSDHCSRKTPNTETEPEGRILRQISLENVGTVSVDGVDISVEISPSRITTEQTALLHITFTNTSDEKQTFGFHGTRLPFSKRTSSDEYSWVLLTEADEPSRSREDCWRPAGDRKLYYQLDSIEKQTLSPCESLSSTLQLWTHPKSEECMPTGEYAFHENTFIVFDTKNGTKSEKEEFSWGFEVDVQLP